MVFYDKFGDRFKNVSKVRILLSARQRSSNLRKTSKENVLGDYNAVTLKMLYLKVLHDMVSQNS